MNTSLVMVPMLCGVFHLYSESESHLIVWKTWIS